MRILNLIVAALILLPAVVAAQVQAVASTADLAYFVREVGGDLVEVTAIARPTADVHFVEVRPSYMIKVQRADVVFKVGLELDLWMDQIIDGSRNSRLVIVDCSRYIEPLEVPGFKADARYGDLHRFGNPHYWLGPQNVKPITDAILEGLCEVDPINAEKYRTNQSRFLSELETGLDKIEAKAAQLNGVEIVTYHNSWPYFSLFTGLKVVGFIEPYPGVSPSPTHVKKLTEQIRQRHIRVIGVEPYFDQRVPKKISEETGAAVVTLYPSLGARSQYESYVQWLEANIDAIIEVFK
jgi:zinc/manganese transport system substrate-binding protein